MTGSTLLERLARGPILCAEGYLFELERRGYLQAGAYVPEVVLDRPELVDRLRALEDDFGHTRPRLQEAAALELEQIALRAQDGPVREPLVKHRSGHGRTVAAPRAASQHDFDRLG